MAAMKHDAYYRAYLPALLALHERLSTKSVVRRWRANAHALKEVVARLDADRAANAGQITDFDLVDTYDQREDLNGGLLRILAARGVQVCDYCLLEDGWHERGCREELAMRLKP